MGARAYNVKRGGKFSPLRSHRKKGRREKGERALRWITASLSLGDAFPLSLSSLLHPFGSHVDHGWLATTKAQHPKREEREAGLREGLLLFSLPPVFPRRKRRGRKEGKRCSENLVRSLVFTLVRSPVLKSSPRLRVLRLPPSFAEGEKVGENQQPFHPTSLLTAEERQRATWNQRHRNVLKPECLPHLYKKPYQAAISQKEVQSDPRVSGPTSCS